VDWRINSRNIQSLCGYLFSAPDFGDDQPRSVFEMNCDDVDRWALSGYLFYGYCRHGKHWLCRMRIHECEDAEYSGVRPFLWEGWFSPICAEWIHISTRPLVIGDTPTLNCVTRNVNWGPIPRSFLLPPFFFSLPLPPLAFSPLSLSFSSLRSRTRKIQLGDLGERCELPTGLWGIDLAEIEFDALWL